MANAFEEYQKWLNSSLLSPQEKEELSSLNKEEINDRFYKDLTFGTGGLRGVMGIGTNRMNRYIIRKATQGLANYLLNIKKKPSVSIAYDSRNNSDLFAKEAARVLASNNIEVYLSAELMPTPFLSFSVRYLKCDAGIVITASHNPKQYNGYKVYGNDGCQCTLEMANAIYQEIQKIDVFNDIRINDFDEMKQKGLIALVKESVVEAYINSTLKESIYQEERSINIVYTPLNGAGRRCIASVLSLDGFKNVKIVKEQEMPNGDFPTCPYPNPEIHEALALGIDLLNKENYDILIASDPDSDRLGCAVKTKDSYRILTGNEVGLLILDALLSEKGNKNKDGQPWIIIKTIVSTDMANIICNKYGLVVKEVLTGFKFIGEQILFLEQENARDRFLMGFEESCGYLTNTDVRDKDAVNAALLIAEIANHYKKQGLTLVDRLDSLYREYGDYKTSLMSFEYQGEEGQKKIQKIMATMREPNIDKVIPNIESIGDYKTGLITGKDDTKPTGLPKSDVIKFFLRNGETIVIRPSGTEPKLKAYVFALGQDSLDRLVSLVKNFISNL